MSTSGWKMGSYTFQWPHPANEVFVTGSFDDWGKTVKLDRKGDVFTKEVQLPSADEKVHYKFVVDGIWTTDSTAAEEDDGSGNINNVLYPGQLKQAQISPQTNGTTMATVTPEVTEAAIAAGIHKGTEKKANEATISSAAPESTTAGLAKAVPLEQRSNVPGTFPETPGQEAESFSVNPIPASGTSGNPISLKPGEKVPDPSTFTSNTVQSTARTDPAGYTQDPSAATVLAGQPTSQSTGASDLAMPPVSSSMIPESSLPMGEPSQGFSAPGVTIQSAAPTSTTAALAAAVPLESQRPHGNAEEVADDVPKVVRESIAESHRDPEAAANKEAVEEKKEMEEELQRRVTREESTGTPAPSTTAGIGSTQTNGGAPADEVPEPVKHSIAEAHKDPEAAANPEAVEEKKEMEDELQRTVPREEHAGAPAPTATAATSQTAPRATGVEPESQPMSPGADSPQGPTVTTGVASAKAPEVSGPGAAPGAGARTGQNEGSTTLMPSSIPDKAAAPSESQTAETSGPSQTTAAPATTASQAQTAGTTDSPSKPAGQRNGLRNGTKEEKKKKKSFWSRLKEKLK
ncbi:hypothetical protein IFM61606_07851 [Aspergillus udagawae]|uniref:AMP-activated protein kinase glycogen-binding domain-containing protein n=2 Tax=Aspergillus udagawae TaxID=91492 RepID=A0A8H3SDX7_9EURO|nr:hypothetical protein IFM46972_10793 [Aspergillus udagawae]GFF60376.1 hypothetical protein IFM51744_10298 [Aspergillus udagawae]GFG13399.1 hypothetical protein IFM5058_06426 [Aspergillus udagawae]GFG27793.1 hypothetical protein IFM61606_07851 [Aspergillus udagawae]